ncbi:Protein CBG20710 [Caenorhabditis briggsae]|uniref:Protein CBG20710 n=1 Tax=Caenorhabditis briggsae TaxID=6238 RepID=A8XYF7_CAEBR|nr:Protein CBG20710 [Caenorhabditis briggsae]CAP37674.1 Protein CBG20710 [Caenorhabditis briggsae]
MGRDSSDQPMEVDRGIGQLAISQPYSSSLPSDPPVLRNTIPRNGPTEEEKMPPQQLKEYRKRLLEVDQIAKLDLKIEEISNKMKAAQHNRDNEVIRMNKRRDLFDEEIERKTRGAALAMKVKERNHVVQMHIAKMTEQMKNMPVMGEEGPAVFIQKTGRCDDEK